MGKLARVYFIFLATGIVTMAATTAIGSIDYKIRKAREEKNRLKREDEQYNVVRTIDAKDIVEIYHDCEVA